MLKLIFKAYKSIFLKRIFPNKKNYYQKKKKLRKEAHKRYQSLSEEEKDKRQKKAWERYENLTKEEKEKKHNKKLSEEQKKKLAGYGKNYCLIYKN